MIQSKLIGLDVGQFQRSKVSPQAIKKQLRKDTNLEREKSVTKLNLSMSVKEKHNLTFELAQYQYFDTQIFVDVSIKDHLRMIPASDLFFIDNYKP